jgi:PPOX class probable F420-dependent enzyme
MIPPELLQSPYLSLATFRKSGAAVATPVWFAHDGQHLYVLSAGEAGKIKRLRNSPRARVARCTYKGDLLDPWHDAEASLLTRAEVPAAHSLFVKKYGWQMRSFDFFSRLGGRYDKRAYLKIRVLP